MRIYNNENENENEKAYPPPTPPKRRGGGKENEKAYPQPLPKGGGGVTKTKTIITEKLTPELIAELRAQATEFAKQIGVKSCSQDCSACWLYRSDLPCPQRDIINAYIAGGEAILRMVE